MKKTVADRLRNAPDRFYAIQLAPRYKFLSNKERGLEVIDAGEGGRWLLACRRIVGMRWNPIDSYFQVQIIPDLTCNIPYEAVEKFKRLDIWGQ